MGNVFCKLNKMNPIGRYQELTLRLLSSLQNKDIAGIASCIQERQWIIEGTEPGDPFESIEDHAVLLKQISDVEKECIRICQSDLDALKAELLNERRKRQGRQGYGPAPDRPAARFIDRRVE